MIALREHPLAVALRPPTPARVNGVGNILTTCVRCGVQWQTRKPGQRGYICPDCKESDPWYVARVKEDR